MPETSPDVVVGFRLHPTRQRDRGDVTTKRDGELAYPYAFASNDDAFGNIGGGVLWLISSPRYGAYRLPPSLVARLHIDRVVSRDQPMAQKIDSVVRNAGLHIAIADRDRSVYLPMNNAYHVLKRMRFDGKVTQLRCAARRAGPLLGRGPYTHLPSHFQRHRVLAPGGVATLEDYAEAVSKGRRVF